MWRCFRCGFDGRSVSREALAELANAASNVGLPMLDPMRLGDTDRNTFYHSYLQLYRVQARDVRSVKEGLLELGIRQNLLNSSVNWRSQPSLPEVFATGEDR